MCDTAVALGNSTLDGKVYFAKNSDRDPNEAQFIEVVSGKDCSDGEKVRCTYIEIPQVNRTHTILISRPYWMWGAEMGTNEFGVTIGNEAVFTKLKAGKEPGLIGMDFLRLALERSRNAEEAMRVIVALLEEYGQSGNCSLEHNLFYHNSFLIADRNTAWVLETADKQWAALKVKDVYSISNRLTIGNQWDMSSDDLVHLAVDHKWCKGREDFHFADCYSDLIISSFSQAKKRRSCSMGFLEKKLGKIGLDSMLSMLRTHEPETSTWHPDRSLTEWTVCVHKGFGPVRASQSVGSLVSRLGGDHDLHLVTGTSAPCLSLFKPVWLDAGLPDNIGPTPDGYFNPKSLWWQHEVLHREVIKDFYSRMDLIEAERNELENEWVEEALKNSSKNVSWRRKFSEEVFSKSMLFMNECIQRIRKQKISRKNLFLYDWEWKKHNRKAKIPV